MLRFKMRVALILRKLNDLDAFEEDLDDREDALDRTEVDNAEIRQIDATLARFSAVHDEIAREEAARRKKYAWLLGKRKEPELGTDMPFDFHEGRDGKSRMEWKKQQRKRRTNLIVMAIAMAASLTVFVTIGIAWSAKSWVDGRFHQVQALDPGSASIKDAAKQTGDQNFLLVGSDSREGMDSQQEAELGTGDAAGRRTDTMMLVHIPAGGGKPALISLPRDSYVPIPGHGRDKLNSAFAIGGPQLLARTVEQVTDVHIDHYAEIGFGGFSGLVDAVGGVDICLDKPMDDEKANAHLPAGCQDLDGPKAL